MARVRSGTSTEAFSSTRDRLSSAAAAAVGLGSILRDQKTCSGTTSRANIVLFGQMTNPRPGVWSLSNSPVPSLASSPVESVSLSESDDTDSLKEEDIWTMETTISRSTSSPSLSIKHHQLVLSRDFCTSDAHKPPPYHNPGFIGQTRTPSHATFSQVQSELQGRHSRTGSSSRHRFEKGAGFAQAIVAQNTGNVRLSPLSKVSDSAMVPASSIPTRSVKIPQVQEHESAHRLLYMEHQSAPVNVPDWSKTLHRDEYAARNSAYLMQESDVQEDEIHEERLPPHVILAREYERRQMMTSSVCEGHGRTLKGRDMSRVRNAVWRQTGFAD